jgi:hypothetical protein
MQVSRLYHRARSSTSPFPYKVKKNYLHPLSKKCETRDVSTLGTQCQFIVAERVAFSYRRTGPGFS